MTPFRAGNELHYASCMIFSLTMEQPLSAAFATKKHASVTMTHGCGMNARARHDTQSRALLPLIHVTIGCQPCGAGHLYMPQLPGWWHHTLRCMSGGDKCTHAYPHTLVALGCHLFRVMATRTDAAAILPITADSRISLDRGPQPQSLN